MCDVAHCSNEATADQPYQIFEVGVPDGVLLEAAMCTEHFVHVANGASWLYDAESRVFYVGDDTRSVRRLSDFTVVCQLDRVHDVDGFVARPTYRPLPGGPDETVEIVITEEDARRIIEVLRLFADDD